jgi:hypothetical protein
MIHTPPIRDKPAQGQHRTSNKLRKQSIFFISGSA